MKANTKNPIREIDAKGKTLGRVASATAIYLMGKNRPSFERHRLSGEKVLVKNAGKIRITAKKLDEITHKRYSGFRGGLRVLKGTEVAEKKGMKEMVRHAGYQMLPGNKLPKAIIKNL